MKTTAPNMSALIGDALAGRHISHAGSLTNLAKCPASTIQILGAEKALFRALKTRGNTPKYGLAFHSSFIGRAGAKNKGRISRYLANKIAIAAPDIDPPRHIAAAVFEEEATETPEEAVPEEAVPEEATPDEATPAEATPEEATPEEVVPEVEGVAIAD